MSSQYLMLLTMAMGLGSVLLTGVITHIDAPAQFKSLVNLVLSLGVGAIEQAAQAHGPFTWHGFLVAAAVSFTAGSLAHETSLIAMLTGPSGLIANYVPGGIGGPVPPAPAVTTEVPMPTLPVGG